MVLVWFHRTGELADGSRLPVMSLKFKDYSFAKQPAENRAAAGGGGAGGFPEMAGGSGRLHPYIALSLAFKVKIATYTVQIKVMPLKELLDPQGKAIAGDFKTSVSAGSMMCDVGKNITLQIDADSTDQAKKIAEEASPQAPRQPGDGVF